MTDSDTIRPEITALTEEQKKKVGSRVRRRRARCRACGNKKLVVGDALFVGFLFRSEDIDAYMVALTCTNRACPAPHTGITLAESQFMTNTR